MNHDKSPAYLSAHAMAEQEVKEGHALSFLTGYTRETGRYIELQTDQGWYPFWQEHHDEAYQGANDTTPD